MLAANADGSWPPHLDASGTAFCRGTGRSPGRRAPRADGAPSGIPASGSQAARVRELDALAETPRRRARAGNDDRPTYLERREARFRERALLDLGDGPAGEDLDDTLYRARESRGGLPTLGSRHR